MITVPVATVVGLLRVNQRSQACSVRQPLLIFRVLYWRDVDSIGAVPRHPFWFVRFRRTGIRQVLDLSASKFLLVQSEPVLAELTQFRLELLGYQIELVGSGGEATLAIDQSTYDLVIVDTKLVDGDGIEWISQTRGSHGSDQLPVIVFSLDPSLETVERAFHAGANDYLITPFDPTVMEEKIESILAMRSALAGNRRKD